MKVMRLWLEQRHFQAKTFEYVISGSGTLVRLEFTYEAEAVEFAKAFAGFVTQQRPALARGEDAEIADTATRYDPHD
jgi:hypothetical protein